MTRKELAALLGYKSTDKLRGAFSKAKSEMPDIAKKITFDCKVETSFTREEIECICRNIPLNEIELQLVMENYIDHGVTYIQHRSFYIEGTEKYLERIRKDPKFRSCANCCYCCGKSFRGLNSKLRPFCKFYNKFISNIKVSIKHRDWNGVVTEKPRPASIFKDRCQSWRRGEIQFFYK